MGQLDLQGLGVALVTPFDEAGAVDYKALGRLVDHQLEGGVDYVVALGTTAETPTLSMEERGEIVRSIVGRVGGRVPVIVGIGGNSTRGVVEELGRWDLRGVDGILSVVPYYNKPSQEGIYRHYVEVAGGTELPVVLYNVPGRVGVNMSAETAVRVCQDCVNVVGVKEASGDLSQLGELVRRKPGRVSVISGDDGLAMAGISMGAVGVISVLGNAWPREWGRMVKRALAGDYMGAAAVHHRYGEMVKLLFAEGSPSGVKCVLGLLGLTGEGVRLPLVGVSAALRKRMVEEVRVLGVKC
jgi:4-hydroxy-tetrahydrodipicolinate synthase